VLKINKLFKLTKEVIQEKYLYKPILISTKEEKNWYIVADIDCNMPLHMLTEEEADLYDLDENNIEGIKVMGAYGEGYLMWIYFGRENGWQAFGYE
jgi:hypothetical protein